MANEIPHSSTFGGLSRAVIAYSEGFARIAAKAKLGPLSDSDWAEMEALIDVPNWTREGVFLGPKASVIDWATYRNIVSQYAAAADWEGTLRHITEGPRRVILELEERNTRGGVTDISNTVTIYEFNDSGKLRHLDVYVMPKGERPA